MHKDQFQPLNILTQRAGSFEKQRFNNTKLAKVNIGYINGKAKSAEFPLRLHKSLDTRWWNTTTICCYCNICQYLFYSVTILGP